MTVGPAFARLSAVVWAFVNSAPEDSAVEQRRIASRHTYAWKGGGPAGAQPQPGGAVIPLVPTWSHFTRLPSWNTKWRQWFPFNVPAGNWTFSGRVALYHGLATLNLPPHSTILVPSYHQGVEIDAILAAGYRLRYYRVTERLEVDFADVERRLDDTVSALYITHYFGFPQPLEHARRLCAAHRLRLIEDCALSLFSRDKGTSLGSVGDLASFSVYKTLPVPHGGFLVTQTGQASAALPSAPLASTVVQMGDLVHQGLRASGWGRFERWAAQVTKRFGDRKSTRLNSSHLVISYAVFCLKKKIYE